MIRISPLASGSSGNSILISSGDERILIDVGISCRALNQRLRDFDLDLSQIQHVLLTHEHSDHIRGMDVTSCRYPHLQFHANSRTARAARYMIPRVDENQLNIFQNLKTIQLGKFSVLPFPVPHDAADPVGYRISDGEHTVIVASDLGSITPDVLEYSRGADALVLESNHNLEMLENGPYPHYLKARIASAYGHLENGLTVKLLREVMTRQTQAVILTHLSEQNNTPEIAYQCTKEGLKEIGRRAGRDYLLEVATRNGLERTIILE